MSPPLYFLQVAQEFLSLLAPERSGPGDLDELSRALDRLALAYPDAPVCEPSDEDDEAPNSSPTFHERAAKLFPMLGYYAVTPPELPDGEQSFLLADAHDDLGDIAGDIAEVLWSSERFGRDDAAWRFRFTFESHWGRHLHDLRSYLHAVRFES